MFAISDQAIALDSEIWIGKYFFQKGRKFVWIYELYLRGVFLLEYYEETYLGIGDKNLKTWNI